MAGNQNSGGMQPNAPQNNPANINPLGGNGQSGNGQAKMYIPGMSQMGSSGVETMAQQSGATMHKDSSPTAPQLPPIPGITDVSAKPEQDVMDGAAIGPGANSIPGLPTQAVDDPDMEMIKQYYPIMQFWASQPGSSQATKDAVAYMGTIIQ
jgi:hypothetical protein